jgi:hypothetical protein
MLEPLVDEHVRAHGGDPARSLATLSSIGPALEAIQRVDDPDVLASLTHVGADAYATHYDPDGGTFYRPDDLPDAPSSVRFRRLRPHAKGNLGEVFVARDHELNREVALKEIQEKHADRHDSRQRFLVEAEITGGLEHPGIVPVYGLGRYPDGRPFYAMRFIKGDSLAEAIAAYHDVDETKTDSAAGGSRRIREGGLNSSCSIVSRTSGGLPGSALKAQFRSFWPITGTLLGHRGTVLHPSRIPLDTALCTGDHPRHPSRSRHFHDDARKTPRREG